MQTMEIVDSTNSMDRCIKVLAGIINNVDAVHRNKLSFDVLTVIYHAFELKKTHGSMVYFSVLFQRFNG